MTSATQLRKIGACIEWATSKIGRTCRVSNTERGLVVELSTKADEKRYVEGFYLTEYARPEEAILKLEQIEAGAVPCAECGALAHHKLDCSVGRALA